MTRRMLALAFAALCAPLPAAAGTIGVFTHDYGLLGPLAGQHIPQGSITMLPTAAVVDDSPTGDRAGAFRDSFDLSSLASYVIRSLTLTLSFSGTGAAPTERWYFDIYGSVQGSISDNLYTRMPEIGILDTGTVSLRVDYNTDDADVDVFATALDTLKLDFGFDENVSGTANDFLLYDAVLTVNGAAVVPLPAPGALLAGALLGGALWRRRRARGAAATA